MASSSKSEIKTRPGAPLWHRTVTAAGGSPTAPNLAAWLDDQYNNRARVPDAADYLRRWAADSGEAREGAEAAGVHLVPDVPYGPHASETMDVFLPACGAASAPLLVFIHGGYWRALSKDDFSFVGTAFAAKGARVVVPNYALCPGTPGDPVDVPRIALQVARSVAVAAAAGAQPGSSAQARFGRVVVCGHSAGGHLAAMLSTCDWAGLGRRLGLSVPAGLVQDAVSLSGLFELGSIARGPALQADLRLTEDAQRRCSPAGFAPPRHTRFHALVGALESPMYHAQHALIAHRWKRQVATHKSLPGLHHFSIMQTLAQADSAVHSMLRTLLKI